MGSPEKVEDEAVQEQETPMAKDLLDGIEPIEDTTPEETAEEPVESVTEEPSEEESETEDEASAESTNEEDTESAEAETKEESESKEAASKEGPVELEHYQHVGAYLRDLRQGFNLNIDDVARRLHIRPKYISALEDGRMDEMPGKVYTIGYIQNYAEFLGLDPAEVVDQYSEIGQLQESATFKIIKTEDSQGTPSYSVILVALALVLLGVGAWQLLGSSADEPNVTVDEVPASIDQKVKDLLVITEENSSCVNLKQTPAFPPCYNMRYAPPHTIEALAPVDSFLKLK